VTAFADASAIVTLYVDEVHGDVVRREQSLIVSALSRVEVAAGLWRKHRVGELSHTDARLLVDAFLADWAGEGTATFVSVPPTPSVLDAAVALAGVHGLRTYDAVQLSSARAARDAAPEVTSFLCFDAALSRAAAAEGFTVNPGD
jgi:predicted nucleic acid-binding protein